MTRRFAIAIALLALLAAPLGAQQRTLWPPTPLLEAVTTTASGGAVKPNTPYRAFQAYGATTAGSGAATIVIEVTNIESPTADADWITAGTITLTLGTTRTTDGFVMFASWRNVRARVTAISGTNATVSAYLGS